MKRKSFLQGTVLALAVSLGSVATAQTAPAARSRLVLQVSDADPAKGALALNNAKNVQQELGAGKVDIEIVAYGHGIGMLGYAPSGVVEIMSRQSDGYAYVRP